MLRIRRFFVRLMIGLCLFGGVSVAPARAEVGSYMVSKRPIAEPDGARTMCKRYAWACMTSPSAQNTTFDDNDLATVRRLNTRINRQVQQIDDQRQYARAEVWALPTRRGGDCEDFALLKKRELIRVGIPASRLLIATVLDTKMRGHAVLVVRSHRGDLVLDNLSNQIKSWKRTGYIFLKMQNPYRPGGWDAIVAGGALLNRDSAS